MKKKELNHELNLISFISLLSVLICSLLLTAIWVQIGTVNVKQAVSGQADEKSEKNPVLWARIKKGGDLIFQLEEAPKVQKNLKLFEVPGQEGKINKEAVQGHLQNLIKALPGLRMALVKPNAETLYEDIILLFDQFKKAGKSNYFSYGILYISCDHK